MMSKEAVVFKLPFKVCFKINQMPMGLSVSFANRRTSSVAIVIIFLSINMRKTKTF